MRKLMLIVLLFSLIGCKKMEKEIIFQDEILTFTIPKTPIESLSDKIDKLQYDNWLLKQAIKHPQGKCELCGDIIIEPHYLTERKNRELEISKHLPSFHFINTSEGYVCDVVDYMRICEECAKRSQCWLCKNYYEKKVKK